MPTLYNIEAYKQLWCLLYIIKYHNAGKSRESSDSCCLVPVASTLHEHSGHDGESRRYNKKSQENLQIDYCFCGYFPSGICFGSHLTCSLFLLVISINECLQD